MQMLKEIGHFALLMGGLVVVASITFGAQWLLLKIMQWFRIQQEKIKEIK